MDSVTHFTRRLMAEIGTEINIYFDIRVFITKAALIQVNEERSPHSTTLIKIKGVHITLLRSKICGFLLKSLPPWYIVGVIW